MPNSLCDLSGDDNYTYSNLHAFEHLNHSDLAELLEHERDIPPAVWRLLQTGLRKIEDYPQRFNRQRDDYPSLLALVATSTWDRSKEFCLCGVTNAQGRSQPCNCWNLCPSCSYSKRKRTTLAAYLTRFDRTSWRLVTVSFLEAFSDSINDVEGVRRCWKAAASALHAYQRDGGIRGAVIRLELHLEHFLPPTYFPHLHAVVDAERIDREALAEHVFASRFPEDEVERIMCPVSIHDRALRNERSLANALSYLGKPMDIVTPYRRTWAVAQARRVELNYEVGNFLDEFGAFTSDLHQVRYQGTLHHASGRTLRAQRDERRRNRDVVSAILVENSLQEWDEDDSEPASIFQPPPR